MMKRLLTLFKKKNKPVVLSNYKQMNQKVDKLQERYANSLKRCSEWTA